MPECAIVFADLEGYSRHVQNDEAGTLAYMSMRFAEVASRAVEIGGKLVKTTGDGYVVCFASCEDAISFSVDMQRSPSAVSRPHFKFRIGVHWGFVHQGDNDIFGHAVNIAARVQEAARAGSVALSQTAFERSGIYSGYFAARGPEVLKNIGDRTPIYDFSDTENNKLEPDCTVTVLSAVHLIDSLGGIVSLAEKRAMVLLGILALTYPKGKHISECEALLSSGADMVTGGAMETFEVLRTAFETADVPGALVFANQAFHLRTDMVTVDLPSMLQSARTGRIHEKLAEGIDWDFEFAPQLLQHSPLLDSWLSVTKGHWRRETVAALETCLDRFEVKDEGARRSALALTRVEPGHEPASRVLMEHFWQSGNRVAAIQEFERLKSWLGDRYGMAVSEQTQNLVSEIRAGASTRSHARNLVVKRPDLSVSNFEATDKHSDLAAGLQTDVVAALSRFREWFVTEAESGTQADYVLNATVKRKSFEFNLLRTEDNVVLWRERFLVGSDWSVAQELLVAQIAARMEVYLSADRIAHAFGGGPSEGFDKWMRAEGLLGRWSPAAELQAHKVLEELIASDPLFAPAYASLASIHNVRHVVRPGLPRDKVNTARALEMAQRAVELDSVDARSQLALAWAAAMAGRFDQAVVHLDLAATLNPTSARTAVSAAMGFAFLGQAPRAMQVFERTVETVPMLAPWQWCYGAPVFYFAGAPERALEAAARGGDAIADNKGWKAVSLIALDQEDEAREVFKDFAAEIEPTWEGDVAFSMSTVANWFSQAYPLRRPEDRMRLAAATHRAAGLSAGSPNGSA
ncbi:MAG: adenylate/guanylate cyclase domain-containing protein [Paracoccaceae bacterium]